MLRTVISVGHRLLLRCLRAALRLTGRPRAFRGSRAAVLATISASAKVLEIGPFVRPTLRGPNIRYFDVLDKAGMIELAKIYGDPIAQAVDIDFISSTGDLSVVTELFDVVFSSHCIEHQPDLVRHLQQIEKLLKPKGRYVVVVPDKRYCFDHFIPVSNLDEVLEAWRGERKLHTRQKVVEHRAHITHNHAARHWAGDHGAPLYVSDPQKLVDAANEFDARQGQYIDVHAWQFTPETFGDLVARLDELKISPLRVIHTFQTSPAASSCRRSQARLTVRLDIKMQSMVVGATGIVGGYIVAQLVEAGQMPLALSRSPRDGAGVVWIKGDLSCPPDLEPADVEIIYCTAEIGLLADALPQIATPSLKRVIAFTSTSIVTKIESEIAEERMLLQRLADGELRLMATCERLGVGWTILRPTLIYAEGRDGNVSRLAQMIDKFGVLPLMGRGAGLRQPVHAEDLAIGAIQAAATATAVNKIYALPGGETLSYREMAGRVFDALGRPRWIIAAPPWMWRIAFAAAKPFFPQANVAMGSRMAKDMVVRCHASGDRFRLGAARVSS